MDRDIDSGVIKAPQPQWRAQLAVHLHAVVVSTEKAVQQHLAATRLQQNWSAAKCKTGSSWIYTLNHFCCRKKTKTATWANHFSSALLDAQVCAFFGETLPQPWNCWILEVLPAFNPADPALLRLQPLSACCIHYANVFVCLRLRVWAQQRTHNWLKHDGADDVRKVAARRSCHLSTSFHAWF